MQTVGSPVVLFSLSPSLSFSPCEIDRLFARSSNRAGRGLRAVLAMHAEAEMLLGKETGERQEALPTLTISARDLRARVS